VGWVCLKVPLLPPEIALSKLKSVPEAVCFCSLLLLAPFGRGLPLVFLSAELGCPWDAAHLALCSARYPLLTGLNIGSSCVLTEGCLPSVGTAEGAGLPFTTAEGTGLPFPEEAEGAALPFAEASKGTCLPFAAPAGLTLPSDGSLEAGGILLAGRS